MIEKENCKHCEGIGLVAMFPEALAPWNECVTIVPPIKAAELQTKMRVLAAQHNLQPSSREALLFISIVQSSIVGTECFHNYEEDEE